MDESKINEDLGKLTLDNPNDVNPESQLAQDLKRLEIWSQKQQQRIDFTEYFKDRIVRASHHKRLPRLLRYTLYMFLKEEDLFLGPIEVFLVLYRDLKPMMVHEDREWWDIFLCEKLLHMREVFDGTMPGDPDIWPEKFWLTYRDERVNMELYRIEP